MWTAPLASMQLLVTVLVPVLLHVSEALEESQTLPIAQPSETLSAQTESFNEEEFMENWIKGPGPDICGDWQRTYAQLHRDIRAGVKPKKYITFQDPNEIPGWMPKSGLGDYFNGMVSTFLAGLLTDRAFVMEDFDLIDFVDTSDIDWRMTDDVPQAKSGAEVPNLKFYNKPKSKATSWKDTVFFPVDTLEHFQALERYENIRVGTNGGILTRIFQNPDSATHQALHSMGMRLPTAFGCILRLILRPKREVWKIVLPQVKALRKPQRAGIGIHMRTNDVFAWKNDGYSVHKVLKEADRTVLTCAKKVMEYHIPQRTHPIWLFLSDSAALRTEARHKYPTLVMGTPINPSHPRFAGKKAVGSALAEWLLLSVNHYFVITESGYAKTAAAYNLEKPPIFLFSHYLFSQARGHCDPSRPSSLLDFTRWSGL